MADAGPGRTVIAWVLPTIGLGIFFALIRQAIVDDDEQLVVELDWLRRTVELWVRRGSGP